MEHRIRELALESLNVPSDSLVDWYRRAWFGRVAARMIQRRVRSGRTHELAAILDEGPGDVPRGLLVGAHVGPPSFARYTLARAHSDLLVLAKGPRVGAEEVLWLDDEPTTRLAPLMAFEHLESGKPVYFAADGRVGSVTIESTFLGRKVAIRSPLPLLGPRAGAPIHLVLAVWEGHRVTVRTQAMPKPTESTLGEWYDMYTQKVEEVCMADAANLRLRGGFWAPGEGGVFDDRFRRPV